MLVKKQNLLLSLLVAITLMACGPEVIQENTKHFDQGWSYADSLSLNISLTDTTSLYDLNLIIDHDQDYEYENIYTRIHTYFPDGRREKQVLSLELSDKAGQWLGDCSGNHCTLTIPLQTKLRAGQIGDYRLSVAQFMRHDSLKGVNEVALRLTRAE